MPPREPKDPQNTVALAGTLPADQHNGLKALIPDLIDSPGVRRYAVVEFYAMKDTKITDDGTHQLVVRWSRIEPVFDDDAKAVITLLDEAQGSRLGQLPMTGPLE